MRRNWMLFLGLVGACGSGGALAQKPKQAKPPLAQIRAQEMGGKQVRPLANPGRKATVLFFVMQDCPIANRFAPEIKALCADYQKKPIAFYIVYVERDSTLAKARKHAEEFGYPCPAVLDSRHQLVRALGAKITPEAAVVSPSGKTLYQGRIDDRYVDFGKMRPEPQVRDLRRALDAILAGKPVPVSRTKAVGCFIPTE